MSLVNDKYKKSIGEVFECFKNTEHKIKQFEKEHGELSIPSINELRYVGYHFAEATLATSEVSIRANIQKALNHCKRAKFDTYEASTTLILERIKNFHSTYSHIKETQDIITDYVGDLANVQRITNELQEIVSASYETREQYYEAIGNNHDELKLLSQKFELAKPQIELLVDDNNKKKKSSTRRFVTTLMVSLLGITAILSVRLGVFDADKVETLQENKDSIKVDTIQKDDNGSTKLNVDNMEIKK